jgi:hypothetical protein
MNRGKTPEKESKADYFRVPLTLPRELDLFLQRVGSDAKAGGGFKLAKTTIIRALIRVMMDAKLDSSGIKDEFELQDKIKAAIKKSK